MRDIKIQTYPPPSTEVQKQLEYTVADFLMLPDGSLDEAGELTNLVRVALMTDRLSSPHEILPDPDSIDRRGWWGDFEADVIWDGWQIGCKNWLLTRAKITNAPSEEGSTLLRAQQYTMEALQPLIAMGLASAITVQAYRSELQRINVLVTVYRGPLEAIELRFQNLWQEITEG